MLIVGATGFAVYKKDGFISSFNQNPYIQQEKFNKDRFEEYLSQSGVRCSALFPDGSKELPNWCMLQKPAGENTIAVVGDSHAAHLYAGLSEAAAQHNHDGIALFLSLIHI